MTQPPDDPWSTLSTEVVTGMRDWRTQHPKATFRQIETELDSRLARLRARLLETAALASPTADWAALPPDQQPLCPDCAQPLTRRGAHSRRLASHHDQPVVLARQYGTCSHCGRGVFPPR